jgi:hypothetical protein
MNVCTIPVLVGGVTYQSPLVLANGALSVQNLSKSGGPITVPAPQGGTVTNATIDSVLYGTHVPIDLSVAPDNSSVTITPNGMAPSTAFVDVTFTDASGNANNICTIPVVVT